MVLLTALAAIQATRPDLSVVQALLLGLSALLTFVASVFAAGHVAKQLEVEDATYARALWATLFKNLGFFVVGGVVTQYTPVPLPITLALVVVVIPVSIFRQVFLSTWGQAIRIWIAALGVEIGLGLLLAFGSMVFGERLEERFMAAAAQAATAPAPQSASQPAPGTSWWWLWVPGTVAGISAWLWWRSGRPVYHRRVPLADVRRFLEDFVVELGLGSVLHVEHEHGPAAFRFTISERGAHAHGLTLEFPDRGWSHSYFDSVIDIAKQAGADTNVVPATDGVATRYVHARLIAPAEQLAEAAHRLLAQITELIGLDAQARYTLYARGDFNHEYSRELAERLVPFGGRPRARLIRRTTRGER